jgi:hypothetical protein
MVKSLVGEYLEKIKPFCEQLCLQGKLAETQLTLVPFYFRGLVFQIDGFSITFMRLPTSLRLVADLIAGPENCRVQIAGALNELPDLRRGVQESPKSGEAHAALGFTLNHLYDDGALSAFREALKYAGTESLFFVSHRDLCLPKTPSDLKAQRLLSFVG